MAGFEEFGSAVATSGDRIDAQLEWIGETAGVRFDEIELSVMAHHVEVTPDVDEAVAKLAAETDTTQDQVRDSPHSLIGPVESLVETLLGNRERYGISYVVFLGGDLEAIRPVVEQLAGS
jgi:hypothetical protein